MSFIYSNVPGGAPMPTIPGGYTILEDTGITEANPENGPMATVKFKILNAADRYSFVQQMLGLWAGTPPNISYQAPAAYPPSPNLLCTAITAVEGLGKPFPLSVGLPWLFKAQAVVTAMFTRPPWQAATNTGYFSISWSGAGETVSVPDTAMKFGDGTRTTTPFAYLINQAQITVTRFRMPFIPDVQAAPLLNQVNNAPFQIGWNVYAAGYLVFAGMDTEIEADPLGNITFQCAYKFLYRAVPWNYALHPVAGTFQLATNVAGNPLYNSGNFNLLP